MTKINSGIRAVLADAFREVTEADGWNTEWWAEDWIPRAQQVLAATIGDMVTMEAHEVCCDEHARQQRMAERGRWYVALDDVRGIMLETGCSDLTDALKAVEKRALFRGPNPDYEYERGLGACKSRET